MGQAVLEGQLTRAEPAVRRAYVAKFPVSSRAGNPLRSVHLFSTEVDAFLVMVAPDGTVRADDDSGGGRNVRILILPAVTGDWLILFGRHGYLVISIQQRENPTLAHQTRQRLGHSCLRTAWWRSASAR